MNEAALIVSLKRHEDVRLTPYQDTKGKWTIGCGRNLTDRGITLAESDYLLANDIASVRADLARHCAWWLQLDDVRQRVIAEMAFNLGMQKLLTFKKCLGAVIIGNFTLAADEMLDSKWHTDVGQRAVTLAAMMRTGRDVA